MQLSQTQGDAVVFGWFLPVQFVCTAAALGAVAAELVLGDRTAQSLPSTVPPSAHAQSSSRGSNSSGASALKSSSNGNVEQILSSPLFAPAAGAAAVAAVLSVLLPPEDLPAVSSLCLMSYVAVTVYKVSRQAATLVMCNPCYIATGSH